MGKKKKIGQKDAIRLTDKSIRWLDGQSYEDVSLMALREVPSFLQNQAEGSSRGGKKAAAQKKADKEERNTKIVESWIALRKEGRSPQDIPRLLAKRFSLSARQIRRILPGYK